MNEPKININVMPGAQMNGYVKEQNNYFGNVQKIESSSEVKDNPIVDVEEVKTADLQQPATNSQKRNEERFHYIHVEIEDEEAWRIHDAIKRLVANYRIPDICAYLKELKQKGKLMLPSNPSGMYSELVRLGMPNGEGFSEKNFCNSYMK
jgi:FMN phosphatase YigB (HAD superfamily)